MAVPLSPSEQSAANIFFFRLREEKHSPESECDENTVTAKKPGTATERSILFSNLLCNDFAEYSAGGTFFIVKPPTDSILIFELYILWKKEQ